MKKLILMLSAGLFVSIVSVNAQSDTLQRPRKDGKTTTTTTVQTYDRSTMTKIKSTDVPPSLRQTLSGTEYKGWENSTIYRSPNDEYFLDVTDPANKTKTYHFDKTGKRVLE
jgi:hypothetical protein